MADPAAPARAARLPGIERLRVVATVCVVMFHAAVTYMPHPLPQVRWATYDATTPWADAAAWIASAFQMPVFFVLGGFGAAGLLNKLGPRAAVRHRLRRLGGPLLLGMVLILPLSLYAWLLGYAADGAIPLRKLKSLKLGEAGEGLWGLCHLWFLQHLLIFCLGAIGLRAAGWRTPESWRRVLTSPPGLAGLALATSVPLFLRPAILIGFRHSFWPLPMNLAFYAPFFAVGTLLVEPPASLRLADHRRSGLRAFGAVHVVTGLISLACAWPLIATHIDHGLPASSRWAMAFLFSAACWLISVGAFAAATRGRRPLSAPTAYFAAASIWVYFLHHPVVGLAQVALKPLEWAPAAKFAAVTAYGLAVPLLTYEAWVRRTWVGRVLGVRHPERVAVEERRRAA